MPFPIPNKKMNRQREVSTRETFRFKRFARKSYSIFNSIRKTVTIGALAGSALLSAHAASVEPPERAGIQSKPDTIPDKELDEVVVTASKAQLPLNMTARQVTVITSKEIERSPVRSAEELLNYVPGVDILQRGPHGVQADISLRGGSFDQAAILLNGINLTNPQTGHYSFDIPINLSDIERIEIIQGASSLIFGASAFSGGVNIITRNDRQSNFFVKTEGGMHGLFGAETRGAVKTERSLHRMSAGYKHSDGYIRNSDYNIVNLLWQSRFNIESSTVDIQAGINEKRYGANTFYSAAYPDQYDDTRGVFASIRGETVGKMKFIPQLYWSRHYDIYHLFRPGTPDVPSWYGGPNYHRSDLFGLNLNMQYASLVGITSIGGEFRNEGIVSSNLGRPMRRPSGNYTKWDNRSNISLFAEHNFVFNKVTLSAGGLYNYNSALADTLNAGGFYPAVNISWRLNDASTLFASWNRSTRMPTFTDLYYNAGKHRGFSGLTPEYSQSVETGWRFRKMGVTAGLNLFYSIGDNLIDWTYDASDGLYHARNLASLGTYGAGWELALELKRWLGEKHLLQSIQMGYQYMMQESGEATANNPISAYVYNYLKHKFSTGIQHRLANNLTLSWNLRWQERKGGYLSFNPETGEEIPAPFKPHCLVDAKVNYDFRQIDFYLNFNNLFNTSYVDLGNIPQPGFWLSGGIGIRIQ